MATKTELIRVRVSATQKLDFARVAGGSGRVSEWLRSLGDAAVAVSTGAGEPIAMASESSVTMVVDHTAGSGSKGVPPGYSEPELMAPAQQKKIRTSPAQRTCARERHHRKGVYCASCGKVQ